ncbi:MAG: hypothetical protein IPF78_11220 [Flavobacteriales bacterium]|nr:hypothetical protein [Flavobacteriales bacterium]
MACRNAWASRGHLHEPEILVRGQAQQQPGRRPTPIDELIEEIAKEYNTTTVVIAHDMNSVMGIADEIFFINDEAVDVAGNAR